MTIDELSKNLDKIITEYEVSAGNACSYCDDESNGNALSESHRATAKALSAFKAEILTYLSQKNM